MTLELDVACLTPQNTVGIWIELTRCPSLGNVHKVYKDYLFNSDPFSSYGRKLSYNFYLIEIIQQNPIVCCDDPSVQFKSLNRFDFLGRLLTAEEGCGSRKIQWPTLPKLPPGVFVVCSI